MAIKDFPTLLRYYREKAGLTQTELGEELGLKGPVARVTVCRLEAGDRRPSLERLQELADILGVDAADLVADFPKKS